MADIYGFEDEKDEPDMEYEGEVLEAPERKEKVEEIVEAPVEEVVPDAPKKEVVKLSSEEIEKKVDNKIVDAFKKVKDPEIDMDIWTLGLIYDVDVKGKKVDVTMTFTSPMCPFGPQIVDGVKGSLMEEGYEDPGVEVVFNPLWEPSEEVKEMLGVS